MSTIVTASYNTNKADCEPDQNASAIFIDLVANAAFTCNDMHDDVGDWYTCNNHYIRTAIMNRSCIFRVIAGN